MTAAADTLPNPLRGEASVRVHGQSLLLRPSFAALVAAETELGPLFSLVERAAAGQLGLSEMIALFWHCLADRSIDRSWFGDGIVNAGLANATPSLRALLGQILAGR